MKDVLSIGDSSEEGWKGVCPHGAGIKMGGVISQQIKETIGLCALKEISRDI